MIECFVHWLYYERFPDVSKGDDEDLVKTWGTADDQETLTLSLVKMYVLGDRYIIPQLQRATIDCLFNHMRRPTTTTPNQMLIAYVFTNLSANNPLCRYMVDVNLHYDRYDEGKSPYEVEDIGGWPEAYLLGLARRASHIIANVRWEHKDMFDFSPKLCDYHRHETDEERKRCKEYEP
jgi:hypothetical protein